MTNINNVTVLGAGVLGAQIAYQAAYAGFNVTSYDINDDALAAAKKRFDGLDEDYKRDLDDATDEKISAARNHLSQSSDINDAVGNADLVIEAVPEKIELKKDIWSKVGSAAPEHTIFATNTSTLRPSDFGGATGHEDRFLAMHFANRIRVNRTAEIMPTKETDPQVVSTLVEYANEMGMVPVELKKEHPRYILNSLLVPFLDAAVTLWMKDIAEPSEIDRDWRISTGSPNGPFETMDTIGLHTLSLVMGYSEFDIVREAADRMKKEFVDNGKLGLETREGFFSYDDNNQRKE